MRKWDLLMLGKLPEVIPLIKERTGIWILAIWLLSLHTCSRGALWWYTLSLVTVCVKLTLSGSVLIYSYYCLTEFTREIRDHSFPIPRKSGNPGLWYWDGDLEANDLTIPLFVPSSSPPFGPSLFPPPSPLLPTPECFPLCCVAGGLSGADDCVWQDWRLTPSSPFSCCFVLVNEETDLSWSKIDLQPGWQFVYPIDPVLWIFC